MSIYVKLETLKKDLQVMGWGEKEVKAILSAVEKGTGIETENTKPSGRPKTIDAQSIVILRDSGHTQQETATELNMSITTVRRHWKLTRQEVGLKDQWGK